MNASEMIRPNPVRGSLRLRFPTINQRGAKRNGSLCYGISHLNSERVFDAAFLKSTRLFVDIPESKNRARAAHRAPQN